MPKLDQVLPDGGGRAGFMEAGAMRNSDALWDNCKGTMDPAGMASVPAGWLQSGCSGTGLLGRREGQLTLRMSADAATTCAPGNRKCPILPRLNAFTRRCAPD